MWPVQDLREFLTGTWRIDRTLMDRRHAISGELHGEARFCPAGAGLVYEEEGLLTFGAHQGRAAQSYDFEFASGSGRALVRFRDGRPFHELDLSRGEASVSHTCDPDLYEGCFVALDSGHWESRWKIFGPRKDQEIVTSYTRLR